MAWFFVALPGNLLAFELVSAGAHATYLFRALPAARYAGEGPAQLRGPAMAVVEQVSEALVDARFLREPIHLPAERLSDARYLRYRLAIAALPSLAAARQRFVGRLIHRDEAGWAAALDEAIRWSGSAREDVRWPGGAAGSDDDEDQQSTDRPSADQPADEDT